VATIDKEKVAARLRERAEEIAERRSQRSIHGDGAAGGGSELSDYDQHPADQGTETHDQELDETTDMILADEQRQVEIAQQRLEEGLYGTCIDCGEEIPEARLEAIPEAVRCIKDQSIYEGQLRARGGPPLQAS
jgi:RNA polymerase-binding transcription factor DksA